MTKVQWLSLCEVIILCLAISSSYGQLSDCKRIKKTYSDKGWNINKLPKRPVSGTNLLVCSEKETCCTRSMENKLLFESKNELKSSLNSSFSPVKIIFESLTDEFNGLFEQSLKKSEESLHQMFRQMFGYIYISDRAMYSELYKELSSYYAGADKDVSVIMNNFYKSLFKKVYQMMNSQHVYGSDFLSCAADNMDVVKSFNDMVEKHTRQIKSALVMARTFVKGMSIGRDVIQHVMDVEITHSCIKDFMQLTYCPKCRGLETKPCRGFCVSTMKNCLSDYTSLNKDWNNYVNTLNRLATLVSGPYSYDDVCNSMRFKISEAMMTLQENPYTMKSQIEKRCGVPKPRGRRAVNSRSRSSRRRTSFRRGRPVVKSTRTLVDDFQEKMKKMKNFWSRIPKEICGNDVTGSDVDNCWDGELVGRSRREADTSQLEHWLKFAIEDQLDELKTTIEWVEGDITL